jgi:hypothetical protein
MLNNAAIAALLMMCITLARIMVLQPSFNLLTPSERRYPRVKPNSTSDHIGDIPL